MTKIGDQKGDQLTPRHRFPVLGPENGEAFIELVMAMQELDGELDRLKYPFRKGGAIWALQSQGRSTNASWSRLPPVLYQHAFDVAESIFRSHPQNEWERTGSPRMKRPLSRDGRWHRISDGTIRTIDLGKTEHWTGLFDAKGNQIGQVRRRDAQAISEAPHDFAREVFNFCDVLVMEDFRRQLSNPEILCTAESAWLVQIECDVLYSCLVQEAQRTRRRLILCDPAWTSWTCPHCLFVHKDHDRIEPPRVWKCPGCGEKVQRDIGSCLELLRRYLTGIHITYDIARHGPAGFALRR